MKENVLETINVAFKQRVRPSQSKMARSTGLEALSVARQFGAFTWQELPYHIIEYEYSGLHFLSDEAFAYYLPSFMLACIQDDETGLVSMTVFGELLPPNEEDALSWLRPDAESWLHRVGGLTEPEREAVAVFLKYMKSCRPDAFDSEEDWLRMSRFWGVL